MGHEKSSLIQQRQLEAIVSVFQHLRIAVVRVNKFIRLQFRVPGFLPNKNRVQTVKSVQTCDAHEMGRSIGNILFGLVASELRKIPPQLA
jgi:hypothetical protein